jgi:serine protease Do
MHISRNLSTALLLWAGAAVAAPAPKPAPAAPAAPVRFDPAAVDSAIRKVFPALVRIHVVVSTFRDGREVKGEATGSGVIISPEGDVVTNHHVAGRARRVFCTLADRKDVDAVVVGSDPLADIAVIRLDPAGRPYPYAAWGDAARLKVGDPVLAMGSPLALSQSVTRGIVANTAMMMPQVFWPDSFRLDGEEVGTLVRWIGHDAAIFPGNSGGPLVNLAGEVVGINEISLGLAGAIPSDLARGVAGELLRRGDVHRSWLGLEVQPLIKGRPGYAPDRGALVASVAPGSPAAEAGLRPGDVLLSFQGAPVNVRHDEELPAFHRRELETPVGTSVELTYERWTFAPDAISRTESTIRAVTVERGPAQGKEAELASLGMTARELTRLAAAELKRAPGSGVLVTGVRSGSPAAEAKPPLQPEDVVVALGARPVRSLEDLSAAVAALPDGPERPRVVVAFERRGQALLTVVRPGKREDGDRSVSARKAWLPVSTQVLTAELAEALGQKGKTGVRVTQVQPGSTAEAAGLRVGDVLLRLDGQDIPATRAEDAETFPALLRPYPVGSRVRLEGVRDGAPLALEVELVASPPASRELKEYRDAQFEFAARDLTSQDRLQELMDRAQVGALVTRVEPGGWAALAHLAVGDVLLGVDGERVDGAAALEARMKKVAGARPSRVVFFVLRGASTRFLELTPAWAAIEGKPVKNEEAR